METRSVIVARLRLRGHLLVGLARLGLGYGEFALMRVADGVVANVSRHIFYKVFEFDIIEEWM